jgi:hypothetical protein
MRGAGEADLGRLTGQDRDASTARRRAAHLAGTPHDITRSPHVNKTGSTFTRFQVVEAINRAADDLLEAIVADRL